MRRHKQQRKVEVVAPGFMSLPRLVIGTSRIATMHRRLARHLTGHLPLFVREVPSAKCQVPSAKCHLVSPQFARQSNGIFQTQMILAYVGGSTGLQMQPTLAPTPLPTLISTHRTN